MFWSSKPTIDEADEDWQLETWRWLLDNLGGLDKLNSYPLVYPSHSSIPRSGLQGHEHVSFVFDHVAKFMRIDSSSFRLEPQDAPINPTLGPLAVVQNVPNDPAGTYKADGNSHVITYNPQTAKDLENLVATLAHELCHAILFSIPTAPPGEEESEEFATDLATVFFGFGIFGGNQSFRFEQFRDDATGSQGWSTMRTGYLTQNEWGYALAVRAILTNDSVDSINRYASRGLAANFRKNFKHLSAHSGKLTGLQ